MLKGSHADKYGVVQCYCSGGTCHGMLANTWMFVLFSIQWSIRQTDRQTDRQARRMGRQTGQPTDFLKGKYSY